MTWQLQNIFVCVCVFVCLCVYFVASQHSTTSTTGVKVIVSLLWSGRVLLYCCRSQRISHVTSTWADPNCLSSWSPGATSPSKTISVTWRVQHSFVPSSTRFTSHQDALIYLYFFLKCCVFYCGWVGYIIKKFYLSILNVFIVNIFGFVVM